MSGGGVVCDATCIKLYLFNNILYFSLSIKMYLLYQMLLSYHLWFSVRFALKLTVNLPEQGKENKMPRLRHLLETK